MLLNLLTKRYYNISSHRHFQYTRSKHVIDVGKVVWEIGIWEEDCTDGVCLCDVTHGGDGVVVRECLTTEIGTA